MNTDATETMSTGHAALLLELLAEYATRHGADCSSDMTVVSLANDLEQSLRYEYAPKSRPMQWAATVTGRMMGLS